MNIFWNVPDGRAMRWVPLLVLLVLGFVGTGIAQASSEITRHPSSKTPGEQLIEFMTNPPENYDVGMVCLLSNEDKWSTNYYRMKKESDVGSLYAMGLDEDMLVRKGIGPLTSYLALWSWYKNAYWMLGEKEITTWTNRGIPSEENNRLFQSVISMTDPIGNRLRVITCLNNAIKDGNDHFYLTNRLGEREISFFLSRSADGYITRQELINEQPRQPFTNKDIYLVGTINNYSYETNIGLSFFPNKVESFNIYKTFHDGKESFSTNKQSLTYFTSLTINPIFERTDFAIGLDDASAFRHYWVQGTNLVYNDPGNMGQIKRILTVEEDKEIQMQKSIRDSKYRYLYVVLAVSLVVATFLLTIKKGK